MAIDFAIDPMSEDFRSNSAQYYSQLLRERPVAATEQGHWLFCKHADVHRILTDNDCFRRPLDWSVERKPEGPLREFARNNMISMNPPQHTRFRQSAARGLSRKASAAMATKIERLVDKLLDDMGKKDGGDFITDFAFPLPVYVICELLGISHEDHDMFGQCTADMLASLEMSASEEVFDRGSAAANILFDYCKAVAADREKAPRDDLISMLIDKEREDKMSRDELIWLTITMLIAGHETTTHMLGNGMLALVRHSGQYELLANNPGLSAGATEEILRYDPTLYVLFRESIVDVHMGGYNIPAGSFLLSSLYGANHDPEVFDGPDCFDIQRANANMHLTFAAGRNLCLGHWLARLEGEIAFARIFKKIKNFQMTGNPLPRNGLMFRGHFSLPMSWQAIV